MAISAPAKPKGRMRSCRHRWQCVAAMGQPSLQRLVDWCARCGSLKIHESVWPTNKNEGREWGERFQHPTSRWRVTRQA